MQGRCFLPAEFADEGGGEIVGNGREVGEAVIRAVVEQPCPARTFDCGQHLLSGGPAHHVEMHLIGDGLSAGTFRDMQGNGVSGPAKLIDEFIPLPSAANLRDRRTNFVS